MMNNIVASNEPARPPGSRAFRAGAWLLIVVSAGHLFWHVTFYGPFAPRERPIGERGVLQGMEGLRMALPGPARSLLDLQIGFSVTMGAAVLGLGLLNLALERAMRRNRFGVPASISLVNLSVITVLLAAAMVWLAPMPLPFLLASNVCFAVSAVRSRPVAHEARSSDESNVVSPS